MSDRDSRHTEEDSVALREERARARDEEARMAAAEGPLARIAELARARAKSRTLRPRRPPPRSDLPQSEQPQAEPGPARAGAGAREEPTQPPSDPGALEESQDSVEGVDSVTQQVALQQELDTLRRTLREKARLVESTAAQCRSLEDQLEDQRLASDELKQDLERKKLTLAAEREQAARVGLERNEVEERYQDLLSSRHGGEKTGGPAGKRRFGPFRSATRLFGGLALAVLLAAIAFGVWLQLDPLSDEEARSPGEQETAPPALASAQTAPQAVSATEDGDARPAGGEEQPGPVVLGTKRDRLSSGSTGPRMLVLQGGDFTMGKRRALPDDDEGPAHGVRLASFLIAATEVTFEEYDRFARASGRRLPNDYGWGRGRRPVIDVSWEDARAYAQWLSGRTGKRYRLPSEAEWEYAAGSGERATFWWGYRFEQNRAVCFDCGTQWDNRSTAPVGVFDPNPLGLHDTAGNVMEWVEDCYHPNYAGAPSNGQPWGSESCRFRVARGGSFNKPGRSMRTTARHRFAPGTRINALGFRIARDE